ncbi:hypothetical protein ACFORL_07045 [Legionella dresdenensis]|uniref:FlgJ-like protein n=1 Tax=Legionella dresdenensis TaxID=450200 RepID=A0ABV8CF84_9GAMM
MRQLDLMSSVITSIHPNIIDILFKHKKEISRKLADLKGLYFIDHVSLVLINPGDEMVIFSMTPSVEFNLLVQGLWQHDLSFRPQTYVNQEILFWEKAYTAGYQNEIKRVKETEHHFSLGLSVMRKINSFHFIYNFATRHTGVDMRSYYQELVPALYALGDYGYKQLQPIYQQYCQYASPLIEEPYKKKHLKLIINNS